MLSILILFLLIGCAKGQIQWLGSPFAQTSARNLTKAGEGLVFTQGDNKDIHIKYSKTLEDTLGFPYMKVYLVNEDQNKAFQLAESFDAMKEPCSCYYINGQQVTSKYGLETSLAYRIIFESANDAVPYRVGSGFFGIIVGDSKNAKIDGLKQPPQTLPDDTKGGKYKSQLKNLFQVTSPIAEVVPPGSNKPFKNSALGVSPTLICASLVMVAAISLMFYPFRF
jgi:hypothetical protein